MSWLRIESETSLVLECSNNSELKVSENRAFYNEQLASQHFTSYDTLNIHSNPGISSIIDINIGIPYTIARGSSFVRCDKAPKDKYGILIVDHSDRMVFSKYSNIMIGKTFNRIRLYEYIDDEDDDRIRLICLKRGMKQFKPNISDRSRIFVYDYVLDLIPGLVKSIKNLYGRYRDQNLDTIDYFRNVRFLSNGNNKEVKDDPQSRAGLVRNIVHSMYPRRYTSLGDRPHHLKIAEQYGNFIFGINIENVNRGLTTGELDKSIVTEHDICLSIATMINKHDLFDERFSGRLVQKLQEIDYRIKHSETRATIKVQVIGYGDIVGYFNSILVMMITPQDVNDVSVVCNDYMIRSGFIVILTLSANKMQLSGREVIINLNLMKHYNFNALKDYQGYMDNLRSIRMILDDYRARSYNGLDVKATYTLGHLSRSEQLRMITFFSEDSILSFPMPHSESFGYPNNTIDINLIGLYLERMNDERCVINGDQLRTFSFDIYGNYKLYVESHPKSSIGDWSYLISYLPNSWQTSQHIYIRKVNQRIRMMLGINNTEYYRLRNDVFSRLLDELQERGVIRSHESILKRDKFGRKIYESVVINKVGVSEVWSVSGHMIASMFLCQYYGNDFSFGKPYILSMYGIYLDYLHSTGKNYEMMVKANLTLERNSGLHHNWVEVLGGLLFYIVIVKVLNNKGYPVTINMFALAIVKRLITRLTSLSSQSEDK